MSSSSSNKATDENLNNLLINPQSFSIASYLNTALSSKHEDTLSSASSTAAVESLEDEELQRRMAELALQLQVQTQSCHDEIGRIGAELRAVLPRCAGDLGRLNVGLCGMKEDAGTLLEDHLKSSLGYVETNEQQETNKSNNLSEHERGEEKVEHDANSPPMMDNGSNTNNNHANATSSLSVASAIMSPLETLETLSTLHALQQNLTATKSILVSVSTYDKTIKSLPSLLTSSQNLNHAVTALVTLEEGARALAGMPGQEKRQEEIASTREKILTLLKPELLHALKKMESRLGPLQTCVGMYNSLGKIQNLMEEYVKNRPGCVHKLWFEFGKSKNLTSDNNKNNKNNNKGGSRSDDLEFYGDDNDNYLFDDNDDDGLDDVMEDDHQPIVDVQSSKVSFGEWLSTWYESVLLLLSEEQRRALTVFGPDLAPEIMAKILHECFRPIVSSFKSRLSAILPSHTKQGSHSSNSGSFETICAAYEATLQFLSVAYETMVDFSSSNSRGNNDNSSMPARTKTPLELYQLIRSTFITICSPFVSYQRSFANLESSHSGMTVRVVSRDIHDAVSLNKIVSSASLLQHLQDSVEKLTNLAPFVFSIAQGATGRFESLTSGHLAPDALSVIDTILSRHIGELSIAIHTLSTNILSGGEKLIDTFDEQQVQYALEVLKIAGLVKRDLYAFEDKTRDRLRILMGRVSAAIDEEYNIQGAMISSTSNWSQVPDSLSAAEIEAVLAMKVCGQNIGKEGSTKSPSVLMLQRLATPDKVGKKVVLFPDAVKSMSRLVRSCQSFVFDICSAVPMKNLEGMSGLPIWKQEESMWSTNTPDTYGTLPQTHITQVGEHMLALVQALEPFASDKGVLQLANLVMDGVDHVCLKYWNSFIDAIDCQDFGGEDLVKEIMIGKTLKDVALRPESMQHLDDEEDDEELQNGDYNEDSAMNTFCNKWLDAVCTAVTGQLLDRILHINLLSKKGCEHLKVDLNYIVNVFHALGVSGHPHPLLNHLVVVSNMEADNVRSRLKSFTSGDEQGAAILKVISQSEKKLAEMRGISL